MKQVDTKAYMTALRSLTEQGHSVSVPVAGSSMSPFLAGGRDTVFFSRPKCKYLILQVNSFSVIQHKR